MPRSYRLDSTAGEAELNAALQSATHLVHTAKAEMLSSRLSLEDSGRRAAAEAAARDDQLQQLLAERAAERAAAERRDAIERHNLEQEMALAEQVRAQAEQVRAQAEAVRRPWRTRGGSPPRPAVTQNCSRAELCKRTQSIQTASGRPLASSLPAYGSSARSGRTGSYSAERGGCAGAPGMSNSATAWLMQDGRRTVPTDRQADPRDGVRGSPARKPRDVRSSRSPGRHADVRTPGPRGAAATPPVSAPSSAHQRQPIPGGRYVTGAGEAHTPAAGGGATCDGWGSALTCWCDHDGRHTHPSGGATPSSPPPPVSVLAPDGISSAHRALVVHGGRREAAWDGSGPVDGAPAGCAGELARPWQTPPGDAAPRDVPHGGASAARVHETEGAVSGPYRASGCYTSFGTPADVLASSGSSACLAPVCPPPLAPPAWPHLEGNHGCTFLLGSLGHAGTAFPLDTANDRSLARPAPPLSPDMDLPSASPALLDKIRAAARSLADTLQEGGSAMRPVEGAAIRLAIARG